MYKNVPNNEEVSASLGMKYKGYDVKFEKETCLYSFTKNNEKQILNEFDSELLWDIIRDFQVEYTTIKYFEKQMDEFISNKISL